MADSTERSDRLLVARMLRGDEEAFASFFDTHFQPLYRFALQRVGGDADVAEEVAQTTMCRAMRKLSTYRGEASLMTWLCTICRHEISAYFEKRNRVPPMSDLSEEVPEIRAAIESLSAAGAAEQERRAEIGAVVRRVLDQLPVHYGEALEWKYIDGMSVVEIAERMRVAPKAAESLLTRARAAFRDLFSTLAPASGVRA